jgi:NAD(P)-dependent dehydrogenase (short-subunit alcohol dehydrogenase family)
MEIGAQTSAIVGGGASGLGEATVKALAHRGAKVSIFDINREAGERVARETGAIFHFVDVTDPASVDKALAAAKQGQGVARIVVSCAGICPAMKTVGRDKATGDTVAHDAATFARVIQVNLIGTFNLVSRAAAEMVKAPPLNGDGERGVIVLTSSIAGTDGQIGQVAYAASKAGVAGLALPMARDLAKDGIRTMTIMPGLFHTPMLDGLPEDAKQALPKGVPFPARLGDSKEFAELVLSIVTNTMLNGSAIRLDGAFRMPPR